MYMLCNTEGELLGISETVTEYLNLPLDTLTTSSTELFITNLIPQLTNHQIRKEFKREEGLLFHFDKQKINEYFLEEVHESAKSIDDQSFSSTGNEASKYHNYGLYIYIYIYRCLMWGRLVVEKYGYRNCGDISLHIYELILIENSEEFNLFSTNIYIYIYREPNWGR